MAKRRHYVNKKKPVRPRSDQPPVERAPPRVIGERKPEIRYGQPFILLEDADKNTWEYQKGSWVPHASNIAECRVDCQVKALSQKLNNMTRYEIRRPLPTA